MNAGANLRGVLLATLSAVMFFAGSAAAQVTINPGETHRFTQAHGAQAGCRRDFNAMSCGLLLASANASAANNRVTTGVLTVAGGPNATSARYAEGSVYVDFFVPGSPDNLVDVYISASYDFISDLLAGTLYTVENSLALRVQDRTHGEVFHAAQTIASQSRDGDQGFTDVNFAGQGNIELDAKANWTVKLRRGGLYRLHFELQSYSQGGVQARAEASWRVIGVTVGEDLSERLAKHDTDVQRSLATILQQFGALRAEHAEIKARLDALQGGQDETKQLLLTPQGRRPGFPQGTAASPAPSAGAAAGSPATAGASPLPPSQAAAGQPAAVVGGPGQAAGGKPPGKGG